MTKKAFLSMSGLLCLLLSGCESIGSKSSNLSAIYAATSIMSFILILIYCNLPQKRNNWFILLFSCVFIVNIGYFTLSISTHLNEALLANRIAYFGSVFLPLSMFLSILDVLSIRYSKWLTYLLVLLSAIVFFIAASPGYSTIYYQEVSLHNIGGMSILDKVYGPWHCIYLYYLISYFIAMVCCIWYVSNKKKSISPLHAIVLAIAVLINIGVWFIEQMVSIEFEFLSISYIISELFLLSLHFILKENDYLRLNLHQYHQPTAIETIQLTNDPISLNEQSIKTFDKEQIEMFKNGLNELTKTEHSIFKLYLEHKTTNEILEILNIKLNTLKFHNKNLYQKLGVTSRRQLIQIHEYVINRVEGK